MNNQNWVLDNALFYQLRKAKAGGQCVMANQEQLDILKQGVQAWNEWREKNSTVQIELNNADLIGVNLSDANLSDADLSNANLIGALQLHFKADQ